MQAGPYRRKACLHTTLSREAPVAFRVLRVRALSLQRSTAARMKLYSYSAFTREDTKVFHPKVEEEQTLFGGGRVIQELARVWSPPPLHSSMGVLGRGIPGEGNTDSWPPSTRPTRGDHQPSIPKSIIDLPHQIQSGV